MRCDLGFNVEGEPRTYHGKGSFFDIAQQLRERLKADEATYTGRRFRGVKISQCVPLNGPMVITDIICEGWYKREGEASTSLNRGCGSCRYCI